MADPSRYSDGGVPRWLKLSGIIVIVLALLVGIMLLAGGGGHGPSRHAPSGGADGPSTLSSVAGPGDVGGHAPPPGAGDHTP
jgi:hypothetical protein